MLLEPIRMVADWLARGTNAPSGALNGASSVNALIPGVPRDAGDAQPDPVTVYDATRHNWVARLQAGYEGSGIDFPALAVFVGTDVTTDGELTTTIRDGQVDIACMYVTQDEQNAAASVAGLYTTRAILRSLTLLHAQRNGAGYDTYCRRNTLSVFSCASLKLIHPDVVKGGLVLHSGVVATYHIRDEAP